MYEPEDDYMQEDEETEEIPSEMWQESAWITISAFFEEKGRPPIFYFHFEIHIRNTI